MITVCVVTGTGPSVRDRTGALEGETEMHTITRLRCALESFVDFVSGLDGRSCEKELFSLLHRSPCSSVP